MEWNETSTLQWDWENQGLFSGSELGNNSSKSSISASLDSSSKSLIEDLHKGLNKGNDFERVEPIIGLKLGKRTYFEDVCAGNTEKNKNLTTLVVPTAPAKKSRASQQISVVARCQVEGCNVDLSGAKDYHRKHRVCDVHSKCPKVVVTGQERRFCQQCSRFHSLLEFDHKKRSCRRRLSDHNARRRKPQAETITFNSSSYSSPFYDERQQMSFLMNRAPFSIMRQSARTLWEDSSGLSLARSNGSWINKSKVEGMEEEHVRYSSSGISNSIPLHALDVDKLIPFRSATHEILGAGIDACVPVSNLDRSALSLLSNDSSWGSPHLGQSNLPPFINANHHHHHSHHHRHHNSNMNGYWKDQPTLAQEAHPHQRHALPFENHNNELAGAQYGTSFFDSSMMASKGNSPFPV